MTSKPLSSDPVWKRKMLEAAQSNLKAQCEFLQYEVDEGAKSGTDVSKARAKLANCRTELAKVEEDLKSLGPP